MLSLSRAAASRLSPSLPLSLSLSRSLSSASKAALPPPPPPQKLGKRHYVLPFLWLTTVGATLYFYKYNKNDAHDYWRKMERGEVDGPMFDIGMKGVKEREEEEGGGAKA